MRRILGGARAIDILSTCASADEALLQVKSAVFYGNSALLHYLSIIYIIVFTGFTAWLECSDLVPSYVGLE